MTFHSGAPADARHLVKVLVTGSSGHVGRYAIAALGLAGHDVAPFDFVTGNDVRDSAAVEAAAREADAVVHVAALGADGNVSTPDTRCGVQRFVSASSVNAFGVFRGLRAPESLPIDDDHPCYATSSSGISKLLVRWRHPLRITREYSSGAPMR